MLGGTVVVAPNGSATGTGLAKDLYDVLVAKLGVTPAEVPANVPAAQSQLADVAEALGQAVVAYIVAHGVVTIPAGVPVTTSGSATTQTGATTAAAVGGIT